MSKPRVILKICSAVMLIAAVALSLFNVIDSGRAGAAADEVRHSLTARIDTMQNDDGADTDDSPVFPEAQAPTYQVNDIAYIGILDIPQIGLFLPVCADWSYDLLQVAPCRYSGSPYDGGFVICAHNYSTHFGGIGNLSPGSEAVFTDMNGKVFRYRLAEQELLGSLESDRMTDSGYALSLFTCNWNGSARVTLRFDRIESGVGMV